MADINITGIQIGDNTYYPRRVYEVNYAFDTENRTRGFVIDDCKPIDGLSIIIRFKNLLYNGIDNYGGIKYVWTDLGLIPIKYMNINQPYLYFNEHDMAEFVFRGSGESSVCELVSYPHNMIPITYSNLKTERDNGRLIPGMKYRIIDYVTQCYYTATSSEHPFDIVVTAIDNHTLDENARAMLHDGDEYFANCDLNKWEIKYSLDADPNRFDWAKSGEYVEPYFWMREEYKFVILSGEECRDALGREFNVNTSEVHCTDDGDYYSTSIPNTFVGTDFTSYTYTYVKDQYDCAGFLGEYTFGDYRIIGNTPPREGCWEYVLNPSNEVCELYFEFDRYYDIIHYVDVTDGNIYIEGDSERYTGNLNSIERIDGNDYYILDSENGYTCYLPVQDIQENGNIYYLYEDFSQLCECTIMDIQPITKGIIYHMKDEYGNECPYDFKNIKFKPKGYEEHTYNAYFHTFDNRLGQELTHQRGNITNNVIKPYVSNGVQHLNNIVIAHTRGVQSTTSSIYDNFFDFGCHDMCFIDFNGPDTYSFYRNHFGKNCYNINQFVTGQNAVSFYRNNFGDGCSGFVTNGNFFNNNFGNRCSACNFGENTYDVCFGYECYNIYVGKDFTKNLFGNKCNNNRFGRICTCLELGNRVQGCGIYKTTTKDSLSGLRNNCAGITFQSDIYGVCLYNNLSESFHTKRYVIHSDFTAQAFIPVSLNNTNIIDVYYSKPLDYIYNS